MRLVTLVTFTTLASACSNDDHGGDDTSYNCAEETRDDDFVAGIEKAGNMSAMKFALMTADPAPPARGDNTWDLRLTDTGGTAIAGAQLLVTPFMPDHQHGSPLAVKVEAQTTPGHYKLSPVNMWMPGLWEITIEAQTTTASTDKTVFRFCIPN
jgi:hypothetical protein